MGSSLASEIIHRHTKQLLNILVVWHMVLALLLLSGLYLFWGPNSAFTGLLRILGSLIFVIGFGASIVAALFIQKRDHRGRVISLALNYLGFLFCLLFGMHRLGIFLGIDALAGTFGKGIPFLAGIFVGYLITAFGDRYENYPQKQLIFNRTGKILMAAFGILFLVSIGLFQGLVFLGSQLTNPLTIFLVFGVALFGMMVWAMWRGPSSLAMQAKNRHEEMLSGFLFLSPNLLGFLFFFAGPLLLSFYVSFTNWDAFGTRDFIGLANYAKIFRITIAPLASADQAIREVIDVTIFDEVGRLTIFGKTFVMAAADKLFWIALRNTLAFSLLAVPLSVIPALLLATLLNSKLPGMKFFRAIYFLPSIAAVVGVALIWQWLYNAAVGYINYGITSSVQFINNLFSLGIIDPQVRWLSDTRTALLAVVIMAAWQWLGFNTVLFLAGLQNIPRELYEAATVDGAGRVAQFINVTIPLLAPQTFFVVTTAIINALQLFEQVYVLIPTEPPGGPGNATISLVLHLYIKGFQRFEQGYASAVAWVLFAVIFSVTLLQYTRQQRGGAYS